MVNPVALWSRPRPPFWLTGVRPNSPPQMTRVSSSSRARFRSVRSAATGLVGQRRTSSRGWRRCRRGRPIAGDRAAAGIELDEPHAALDQAAGEQAARAELGRFGSSSPYSALRLGRFRATGRPPRALRLASGRPARSWRSARPARCRRARVLRRFKRLHEVEHPALLGRSNAGSCGVRLTIGFAPGCEAASPDRCAGRKPAPQHGAPPSGVPSRLGHHDERRQVVALAAQPVGDPAPEARIAHEHRARNSSGTCAGAWITLSATHERISAMSSACWCMCGTRSDMSMPDWP